MTYERKIFLMSSMEWRNFSSQGSTYAGYNQSIGNNVGWNRVPMLKSGEMRGLATHYYLNNSNPNTVYANIDGAKVFSTVHAGTTGLVTTFGNEAFLAGDNICLENDESSFSTIIRGYSILIGVFD